jgi:hypothetical protein
MYEPALLIHVAHFKQGLGKQSSISVTLKVIAIYMFTKTKCIFEGHVFVKYLSF